MVTYNVREEPAGSVTLHDTMKTPQAGAGFRRRIYASPLQFLRDLRRIAVSLRAVLALSSRQGIAAGFRERIMLVVTGVNRCRHCAYGHEFLARRAGISGTEIAGLLKLDLAQCPESEIPGLVFAIHWAETDGQPTAEATGALQADYGPAIARQIEAAVLLIHVGNRVGNSFDFLLSRASCGRFGLLASER